MKKILSLLLSILLLALPFFFIITIIIIIDIHNHPSKYSIEFIITIGAASILSVIAIRLAAYANERLEAYNHPRNKLDNIYILCRDAINNKALTPKLEKQYIKTYDLCFPLIESSKIKDEEYALLQQYSELYYDLIDKNDINNDSIIK